MLTPRLLALFCFTTLTLAACSSSDGYEMPNCLFPHCETDADCIVGLGTGMCTVRVCTDDVACQSQLPAGCLPSFLKDGETWSESPGGCTCVCKWTADDSGPHCEEDMPKGCAP